MNTHRVHAILKRPDGLTDNEFRVYLFACARAGIPLGTRETGYMLGKSKQWASDVEKVALAKVREAASRRLGIHVRDNAQYVIREGAGTNTGTVREMLESLAAKSTRAAR